MVFAMCGKRPLQVNTNGSYKKQFGTNKKYHKDQKSE